MSYQGKDLRISNAYTIRQLMKQKREGTLNFRTWKPRIKILNKYLGNIKNKRLENLTKEEMNKSLSDEAKKDFIKIAEYINKRFVPEKYEDRLTYSWFKSSSFVDKQIKIIKKTREILQKIKGSKKYENRKKNIINIFDNKIKQISSIQQTGSISQTSSKIGNKLSIVDMYISYLSNKFLNSQNQKSYGYNDAISEIRSCKKNNHWIWYIFPSGYYNPSGGTISSINIKFQLHTRRLIRDRPPDTSHKFTFPNNQLLVNEVELYLLNPILINRIYDISLELFNCLDKGILYTTIFPSADIPKIRSSMTIFNDVFQKMGIDLFGKILSKL